MKISTYVSADFFGKFGKLLNIKNSSGIGKVFMHFMNSDVNFGILNSELSGPLSHAITVKILENCFLDKGLTNNNLGA